MLINDLSAVWHKMVIMTVMEMIMIMVIVIMMMMTMMENLRSATQWLTSQMSAKGFSVCGSHTWVSECHHCHHPLHHQCHHPLRLHCQHHHCHHNFLHHCRQHCQHQHEHLINVLPGSLEAHVQESLSPESVIFK